jgi:hypothetical protein
MVLGDKYIKRFLLYICKYDIDNNIVDKKLYDFLKWSADKYCINVVHKFSLSHTYTAEMKVFMYSVLSTSGSDDNKLPNKSIRLYYKGTGVTLPIEMGNSLRFEVQDICDVSSTVHLKFVTEEFLSLTHTTDWGDCYVGRDLKKIPKDSKISVRNYLVFPFDMLLLLESDMTFDSIFEGFCFKNVGPDEIKMWETSNIKFECFISPKDKSMHIMRKYENNNSVSNGFIPHTLLLV